MKKEILIEMHHKGMLSKKGYQLLVDMLINPQEDWDALIEEVYVGLTPKQ